MTKIKEDDKKYLREMRESEQAEKEILELKRELIREDLEKSLVPQIRAKNERIRLNREKRLQKNY